MKKNRTRELWQGVGQSLKRRCLDPADARVYINGELIPTKKLKKETRRYNDFHQEGRFRHSAHP